MTDGVLAGIRVIDFTSGPAGGHTTAVMADFGAEVIKVEPPQGDRFRAMPSSPFWLRGKKSVVLDLNESDAVDQVHELVSTAAVVVVSGPPSRLKRWGIDASLRDTYPSLVHCTISAWGSAGPLAELSGYEGIVAAKAGRMAAFEVQLQQDRPVFAAVPVATHVASQAAVQGILAALHHRHHSGSGATVEASLVQALMPFDLVDLLARQISDRDGRSFTPLRHMSPMPTLNYHPVRTSDGKWIQCGNLLEHLFYSFLDAIELLGEFLVDERFQGSPAVWEPDVIEEARDRILLRVQERTVDEWMRAFEANGNVAAEPILTTAAAIQHRDLVEGRGLVQIEDQQVGMTTQVGPIAELSATPAEVRLGSPAVGQHHPSSLSSDQSATAAPGQSPTTDGQPLAGITIVDLSTIIAAPLGATMLADLGARVIKVEPLGGDPYRGLLIEGRMAVKTNAGKESICIDLKKPEGQKLLHQLAKDADVLLHNFRGEVPAKLGIDYPTMAALNPNLIWTVVNGYGPHGPGAKRPATHPVIGACTGGVAHQAGDSLTRDCLTLDDVRETARQIMAANESNPDPNTSVVVASAILLALHDRNRTGQGQVVRVNMQVANAWANGDDFLTYEGKPERPTVDTNHYGLSATYRLYQTSSGWVFLAAPTNADFTRLCRAAGWPELLTDERFGTAAQRSDCDQELAAALAERFLARSADAWETELVAAGVGCVRADGIESDRFFTEHPQMVDNGWSPIVEHLRFGRHRRWGAVVMVDGPNPDYGPAPLAGQHTDELLAGIGQSANQITALRETKIVNSEPITP